MMNYTVTLPWPSKDLSPNARVHWSVKSKAAKALRKSAYVLTLEAGAAVDWEGDVHLFVDYYPPDRRARDVDNCIASSKAIFDGVADALGVNDRRFRLHPNLRLDIGGMVKIKIVQGPQA